MKKTKVGIIGLGRIGEVHLKTLTSQIEDVEVDTIITPSKEAQLIAKKMGVPHVSEDFEILSTNKEIEAVFICSPSPTHAEYIIKSIKAGKDVFCEKPLDLSIAKIEEILAVVNQSEQSLMVAFNQRFDPDFSKIKETIEEGRLGKLRMVKITSRDPTPPPANYVKSSGGLFLDMTIHDFDMARFITGSEVKEVYAKGHCLIDPAIGEAGDIDTGIVVLTFENGVTAIIENSREACYGYDQRLEVFGDKGMAQANHNLKNNCQIYDINGIHSARPLDFFIDRYFESYVNETKAFVDAIKERKQMPVKGEDGLMATKIALAANLSLKENRPVLMSEI